MSEFNHNRKRNVGLVYDMLARQLALSIVENDRSAYERALAITKKYFTEGQPLANELKLFDAVSLNRGVEESVARRIVEEIKSRFVRLDAKKLEIKKSNLVKEINYAFGREFFSKHRIAEYRMLASVQMMLDSCRASSKQLDESVKRIKLEEAIIRYMTSTERLQVRGGPTEKIDGLVCAMAAKRFQEKYGRTLNRDQKLLIEKYMKCTVSGDMTTYSRHLDVERARIFNALSTAKKLDVVKNDAIMVERLEEARLRLDGMSDVISNDPESATEEILLFHKLVDEVNSDE